MLRTLSDSVDIVVGFEPHPHLGRAAQPDSRDPATGHPSGITGPVPPLALEAPARVVGFAVFGVWAKGVSVAIEGIAVESLRIVDPLPLQAFGRIEVPIHRLVEAQAFGHTGDIQAPLSLLPDEKIGGAFAVLIQRQDQIDGMIAIRGIDRLLPIETGAQKFDFVVLVDLGDGPVTEKFSRGF